MTGTHPGTGSHIALIGDYNPDVVAHRGIEASLRLLRDDDPNLSWRWCHTSSLTGDPDRQMAEFSGIWVVPASPYENPDGVFGVIQHARRDGVPFLGTCGGFQHAVIEFARHVLGLANADHAETAPEATVQVITPLRCSLVEQAGRVRVVPGTRFAVLYGKESGSEGYHCSYGLSPEFVGRLEGAGMPVVAHDDDGEVRALELANHPFFVLTLFQPERCGLTGSVHPVVRGFAHAARTMSIEHRTLNK